MLLVGLDAGTQIIKKAGIETQSRTVRTGYKLMAKGTNQANIWLT